MNKNNIIKSRLAVAENTSSLLKSNTKKLNEQLINIERRQYKLTILKTGVYRDSKHSSKHNNKEGKTKKTIVKSANRKDAELVLKSTKS